MITIENITQLQKEILTVIDMNSVVETSSNFYGSRQIASEFLFDSLCSYKGKLERIIKDYEAVKNRNVFISNETILESKQIMEIVEDTLCSIRSIIGYDV